MLRRTIASLASIALCLSFALAQDPTPSESPTPAPAPVVNEGIWRAELPGGKYMVRLADISVVSQHEYVVGGTMRVTEVNIVTAGNALARFYVIEPFTPVNMPLGIGQSALDTATERLREAKEQFNSLGGSEINIVTKTYPATTHAHTIEYRLENKAALAELFESVTKAWTQELGRLEELARNFRRRQ